MLIETVHWWPAPVSMGELQVPYTHDNIVLKDVNDNGAPQQRLRPYMPIYFLSKSSTRKQKLLGSDVFGSFWHYGRSKSHMQSNKTCNIQIYTPWWASSTQFRTGNERKLSRLQGNWNHHQTGDFYPRFSIRFHRTRFALHGPKPRTAIEIVVFLYATLVTLHWVCPLPRNQTRLPKGGGI